MDKSSVIIGIVFLVLIVVAIYFISNSGKKNRKKLLNNFIEQTKKKNLSLADHEIINNFVFGIDISAGKFVFWNKEIEDDGLKVIDLSSVSGCDVLKNYGTTGKKSDDEKPEKVSLVLTYKSKSIPDSRFVLFNAPTDLSLRNELKLAEKWNELINKCLIK